MTINTIHDLAARIGIDAQMQALAAQTTEGGLAEHVRKHILHWGETVLVGRHPSGKGVETSAAAYERITGVPVSGKKARKKRAV